MLIDLLIKKYQSIAELVLGWLSHATCEICFEDVAHTHSHGLHLQVLLPLLWVLNTHPWKVFWSPALGLLEPPDPLFRCTESRVPVILYSLEQPAGFPGGASGKEPTFHCRRHKRLGFSLWVCKIPWRRAWQPTPVFLPGESHGQRSLLGYGP